jgi:regulatory protein
VEDPAEAAHAQALKLLARREHTRSELGRKLAQRGIDRQHADAALQRLVDAGYLSDTRYAQARVTELLRRRYGPLRAQADLRSHGVDSDLIDRVVDAEHPDWYAACRAHAQQTGRQTATSLAERARQRRQLQARGFTSSQIRAALTNVTDDDA